jgi:hypothetical protein
MPSSDPGAACVHSPHSVKASGAADEPRDEVEAGAGVAVGVALCDGADVDDEGVAVADELDEGLCGRAASHCPAACQILPSRLVALE